MGVLGNVPALGVNPGLADLVAWCKKLTQALNLYNNQSLEAQVLFAGFAIPWPDVAVRDNSWYFIEGQLLEIETDKGLWQVYGNVYTVGGDAAGTFRLPPTPAVPYAGHKWMVKR